MSALSVFIKRALGLYTPPPPFLVTTRFDDSELVKELSDAASEHACSSDGLVKAARRQVTDAEFVRQTVQGVLSRVEKNARNRNDA